MNDEPLTITIDEYQYLLERSLMLSALEDTGVDNWDGYDYAIATYNEWLEEKK